MLASNVLVAGKCKALRKHGKEPLPNFLDFQLKILVLLYRSRKDLISILTKMALLWQIQDSEISGGK
jgi:hypothetical protein